MGTTAPPAKSFMDSEVTIDFSDPTTHHDRVLLVAGQKFYVSSSLLSQFSEFCSGLFNSNFKEKNEETIELKDIAAEDFDNFLRALYPIRFNVTVENLASLMQLSIRFLCPIVWGLCMEFLKNKKQFSKFCTRELLQWSEGSDSKELKSLIEQDLIENNITPRNTDDILEFTNLALGCNTDKLKELLEEFVLNYSNRKTHIFKDPQRKTHHGLVDLLYYCEKYDLSIVRKYLDVFFCRGTFQDPRKVHSAFLYLKLCRLPAFEVKVFDYMLQVVNNINEDKKFPPLEKENYRAQLCKNLAIDYLRRMYERIDKTQENVGNFLQIASQFNVLQLQEDVSADLTNDFLNKNGLKYMNLAVKYNLQELKDLIADYLSRTNSSELNDEDQQIILNATPEVKDFVLRNLLKRLSC